MIPLGQPLMHRGPHGPGERTVMRSVLLLLALFCAGLAAADFDAVEFYGAAYFKPAEGSPLAGKLSVALNRQPPVFIELNNSDDGPAQACFEFTQSGVVLRPAAEKSSCELGVDLGATRCAASFSIVELDLGAAVGFHLTALKGAAEFVVEVRRGADGATLRIAKRTRNGMATLTSTSIDFDFKSAATLSLRVAAGRINAEFAQAKVEHNSDLASFTLGVAGSDGRSRASSLEIEAAFDSEWAEDAQARLLARQALARLNEYCTQGLLAGVGAVAHPAQDADLKAYSAQELKARQAALESGAAERFSALETLAQARPKSALAQYDCGFAALLARHALMARQRLEASLAINDCNLTRLVLAEACRRLRDFAQAQSHLDNSRRNLPAELAPDFELLRARLMAARGEIAQAAQALADAKAKWPKHEAIALFAESARELIEPQTLAQVEIEGPFGLSILSDVDQAVLAKLIARLKPFTERIRYWLPTLAKTLPGSIAIYSTPTGYLRAALLVAGDSLDNVAGMFLPAGLGGARSVIACRAFGEDELVRTLAHELWHLAVSTTEHADMEPWLNEGLAVYLSAGTLRSGVFGFGTLPAEFNDCAAEIAKALEDPARAAAAMDAGFERFYLPGEQRLNYAMGWALAWFLAEQDMASARTLSELIAAKPGARKTLKDALPQYLPRIAKALKDRKILP